MIRIKEITSEKFYYNSLFKDYVFNFDNLQDRFQYDYRKLESYKENASRTKNCYDNKFRNEIAAILKKYNARLNCSSKTLENIECLKDKDSVVVIGGQQPGFLGGPAYIIYKILTILKLSSFLQEKLNIRVVPCFWNASDDSNFDNINNLYFLGQELKKIDLNLTEYRSNKSDSNSKQIRFSDIYFPQLTVKNIIDEFVSLLPETEFKPKIFNLLQDCLDVTLSNFNQKDRLSISSFFSAIISRIFFSYGLVVIDPGVPEFKKLSAKILEFDVTNHVKINKIIKENGGLLVRRGYHAQLNESLNIDSLNFFQSASGNRVKIMEADENKLIDIIDNEILSLNLNVVLRPLFQDWVLPVVCTVCGPGEVSYFAQLKEIYNMAEIRMPVIYPRFSATIIENKISSVLEKIGMQEEDFELPKETLKKKILLADKGKEIDELLINFQNDIMFKLENLKKTITIKNINTDSSFDRVEKNIRKELEILYKKIYSDIKKSDSFISDAVDRIYLNLFPDYRLQERVVNIFNYINKYDFGFLDSIYSQIIPMSFSHKFIKIEKAKDGS
ncbi:MAG: bacillithiol biosynthesis cysteine-adding enzyme BshC [Actinobacteria bacterium]|nr:bacillithiol biosynthesis cysteine-adding enzyme BshC [Actinomycetota bacterium]